MGFNTTVVVLNDALHDIENDPEFGKKLAQAILTVSRGKPVDVRAGSHCNAATVIETHHADVTTLVAVGGNFGTVLHMTYGSHHTPEARIRIAKGFAKVIREEKKRDEEKD